MSLPPDIRPSHQSNLERQTTYGLKQTAEGKPYVGMQIEDKNYVLVAAKVEWVAQPFANFLKEEFNIDAVTGVAFDWRASLEENELKTIEIEGVKVLGIYVPENRFEDFLNQTAFIRGI